MQYDRDATANRQTAICAEGLSKQWGGRRILRHIDLEVDVGQCVALAGGNGEGKTTLLGCLAGLIRPTSGQVRWFGQLAASRVWQGRLIGTVGHKPRLYAHLTLEENLVFAGRMCGVDQPVPRAQQLLDIIGLAAHRDRLATHVSRGMRQRVAIARALVHDPPIVLLDEPFSGLDGQGTEWLADMLRQLRQRGRAICFASHHEQVIGQLADRCLRLESGTVCQHETGNQGPPAALVFRAHAA